MKRLFDSLGIDSLCKIMVIHMRKWYIYKPLTIEINIENPLSTAL